MNGFLRHLCALFRRIRNLPGPRCVRPWLVSCVWLLVTACGDDGGPYEPAESAAWTKFAGNPVLSPGAPGSWEARGVGSPSVLVVADTAFTMWYTGTDGNLRQIGLATSKDGIQWTKSPANPVLEPGPPGSWDSEGVETPCVLFDGNEYTLYYGGRGPAGRAIGRAVSEDGIHWVRQTPPVLTASPAPFWDDAEVYAPWVRSHGGGFEMWFTGRSFFRQIGHATSVDGQQWTKLLTPVIQAQVLEAVSFEPCVLHSGSFLRIWYGARHESPGGGAFPGVIDTAQSIDGVVWGAHRTALAPGAAGTWDGDAVSAPCVLAHGEGQAMWYEGWQGLVPEDPTQGTSAIGLATLP